MQVTLSEQSTGTYLSSAYICQNFLGTKTAHKFKILKGEYSKENSIHHMIRTSWDFVMLNDFYSFDPEVLARKEETPSERRKERIPF